MGNFFDAPEWNGHVRLLVLFSRVRLLSEDTKQSSRIRVLMKNLLDERKCHLERPSPPPLTPDLGPAKASPVLLGRTSVTSIASDKSPKDQVMQKEHGKSEQKFHQDQEKKTGGKA